MVTGISEFQRVFFNRGYVETLVEQDIAAERNFQEQLVALVGRLATNASRDSQAVSDEALLLRDQLFELERGRRTLGQEAIAVYNRTLKNENDNLV